jgi:hypothetical protein
LWPGSRHSRQTHWRFRWPWARLQLMC